MVDYQYHSLAPIIVKQVLAIVELCYVIICIKLRSTKEQVYSFIFYLVSVVRTLSCIFFKKFLFL